MKRQLTPAQRQAQSDRYLAAKVRSLLVDGSRIEALKTVRTRLRDDGKDYSLHAARLWCQIHGIEC
jgi:hypothetical protein